jgi:hypothetical protein
MTKSKHESCKSTQDDGRKTRCRKGGMGGTNVINRMGTQCCSLRLLGCQVLVIFLSAKPELLDERLGFRNDLGWEVRSRRGRCIAPLRASTALGKSVHRAVRRKHEDQDGSDRRV